MVGKKIKALVTLLLFVLGFGAFAHGSTTKARPNSLGVEEVFYNPYAYLLALPVDGTVMDGVSSIRFKPYGTPELYDESILFCGEVTKEFDGKQGVLVIVYEKVGHRLHEGLACHELESVFEVKEGQQ